MKVAAALVAFAIAAPAGADPTPTSAEPQGVGYDYSARHRRRIIAVVTGSVGAASIAVGLVHGIGAIADWHDVENRHLCDAGHVCNSEGAFLTQRSQHIARGADILIGSGLLVVGAAAAIWYTAPGATLLERPAITPIVAPHAAGLAISGRF